MRSQEKEAASVTRDNYHVLKSKFSVYITSIFVQCGAETANVQTVNAVRELPMCIVTDSRHLMHKSKSNTNRGLELDVMCQLGAGDRVQQYIH